MNDQARSKVSVERYQSQLILANAIELGLCVSDEVMGEDASNFLHGKVLDREQRARLIASKINRYATENKALANGGAQ